MDRTRTIHPVGTFVQEDEPSSPSESEAEVWARDLLRLADIEINGARPWDIQVHDHRLFERVLREGSLGFGEAYMDNWWDTEALDEFFARVLEAELPARLHFSWSLFLQVLRMRLFNRQSVSHAREVGERHYDIGNDLFQAMLDPTMTYSCGYWKNASTLGEAQWNKLDLICRKLDLQPGHTVLDIGCGWGSFAVHAATHYGAKVTGVTIAEEQLTIAKERCRHLPVEMYLQDYRSMRGQFDRVVSIGMFEHVGFKNYRTYMEVTGNALKEDGLFLLHTIGRNTHAVAPDPWMDRYIFPNGMLPAASQITKASEGIFVMEDWHNFGADYDKTLMTWFTNFESSWPALQQKYGERFYHMWKYYLLSCAGLFRARGAQVWQIVFSPKGVPRGYQPVR